MNTIAYMDRTQANMVNVLREWDAHFANKMLNRKVSRPWEGERVARCQQMAQTEIMQDYPRHWPALIMIVAIRHCAQECDVRGTQSDIRQPADPPGSQVRGVSCILSKCGLRHECLIPPFIAGVVFYSRPVVEPRV